MVTVTAEPLQRARIEAEPEEELFEIYNEDDPSTSTGLEKRARCHAEGIWHKVRCPASWGTCNGSLTGLIAGFAEGLVCMIGVKPFGGQSRLLDACGRW